MKKLFFSSVIASLLSIALLAGSIPSAMGFNVVAIPSVEGPIPITEESQAFVPTASNGPLPVPAGYVVEEFFVSGTALGQAYKTRVFVRRPQNPQKFSGIVVAEPPDGNLWCTIYQSAKYQTDAGHVSVIIEAIRSYLNAYIKPFNPTRYATLNIPNVTGIDSAILAQVGALLKSNISTGLFPDLYVKHVVLAGYSGSAATVRRVISDQHFQTRFPDGGPVYDGYYPQQTSVGTCATPIADLDVPVIEVQGEREMIQTFIRCGSLGYRRPDGDLYRLYEVPGQPHLGTREKDDEMGPFYENWICLYPGGTFATTDPTIATQFPFTHINNMGLRNLIAWIDGVVPPKAARIELAADGKTIMRDQFGNALGGVRTSYFEIPIATYVANSINNPSQPTARCDMIGYQLKFTKEELVELYGNHGGYVNRVNRYLDELVRQGWYLKDDADELRVEAAHAEVP